MYTPAIKAGIQYSPYLAGPGRSSGSSAAVDCIRAKQVYSSPKERRTLLESVWRKGSHRRGGGLAPGLAAFHTVPDEAGKYTFLIKNVVSLES